MGSAYTKHSFLKPQWWGFLWFPPNIFLFFPWLSWFSLLSFWLLCPPLVAAGIMTLPHACSSYFFLILAFHQALLLLLTMSLGTAFFILCSKPSHLWQSCGSLHPADSLLEWFPYSVCRRYGAEQTLASAVCPCQCHNCPWKWAGVGAIRAPGLLPFRAWEWSFSSLIQPEWEKEQLSFSSTHTRWIFYNRDWRRAMAWKEVRGELPVTSRVKLWSLAGKERERVPSLLTIPTQIRASGREVG